MASEEKLNPRIQGLQKRFREWQLEADASKLIFIDESGSTTAMTRTFGRSMKGSRVHDRVPRNRGQVITMLGAIGLSGIVAMGTVNGGTSGDVFVAWFEQVLLPAVQPGTTIVLDNLGAHRDKRVFALAKKHGVFLKFTPPYSPEFNPIELAWSKLKEILRAAKARTREQLDDAVRLAMSQISSKDAAGWFRHCGYWVNQ